MKTIQLKFKQHIPTMKPKIQSVKKNNTLTNNHHSKEKFNKRNLGDIKR